MIQFSGISRREAAAHVRQHLERLRQSGEQRWFLDEVVEPMRDILRVVSFAGVRDHSLMWSHYADSHRGFCLGFDARALEFCRSYKVKYSDRYPTIDYPSPIRVANAQAICGLLVKDECWAYEREYRHVFAEYAISFDLRPRTFDGTGIVYSPRALTSIIFGCEMPNEFKRDIRRWLVLGGLTPTIYEARRRPDRFGLDFVLAGT